ncbi:MAG: tetratricopeptide repeat protein [Myxococcota bacterium]
MGDRASTNLRPSPTRFVGRAVELSQLVELVSGGQRLVTVFGPGGTGKTRTALALCERMQDEYAGLGGVWLCELAAVRDLQGVCETVARTLGIPPAAAGSDDESVRRLGAAMADRGPMLLLLDNFEQLVELASSMIAVWLVEAPELRLVVTSREHLRLRGELRFELSPLALPAPGQPATDSEAVELFVERIRELDPGFTFDDTTTPLVTDLVTRLEGLPLAIELAASQVELLGLQGLLDNLHQRLDVLVGDGRDVEDRHATLRAAIDWSWGLLDPVQQAVLAQCTVFRGGFTAEAARAVLVAPEGKRPPLAVLKALRDKSLLRRDEPDEGAGLPRFSLLDAVREFAAERFENAEAAEQARARHAAWYLDAAERWVAEVETEQGPKALHSLALERGNLLATHEHAMQQAATDAEAAERALRSVLALDTVASIRGSFAAHLELLEQTLSRTQAHAVAVAVRVRVLRARAKARLMHGQSAAAQEDFDEALERAEAEGDAALEAEVLADRGVFHHQRREVERAQALYDQALQRARAAKALAVEGRVLGNLGALRHDRHELDDARKIYDDALEVLRRVGNLRLEAIHVCNLGTLELERGEGDRARGHFEASQQLLEPLGDRRLLAIVRGNQGTLEHMQGRLEDARQCHEDALAILREVGDRRSEALSLSRLGRAWAELGWVEDAQGCLAAAGRLVGRFPDAMVSATVELDRGFVELAEARNSEPEPRDALLQKARDRIAQVSRAEADSPAWIERSDDIRFAVHLLERGLADLDAQSAPSEAPPQNAVLVGPQGRWLQVPGEQAQDLRRRKAMRLILDRLTDEHRANPGAGLPLETLLEVGWPGERVMASAGANRVYVALTTLRKMGLRKLLLSRDDGYLLDPATPVKRIEADWDERPTP